MSDMSYGVASQLGIQNSSPGFMGSKDNAGFLHTRPTYQVSLALVFDGVSCDQLRFLGFLVPENFMPT